MEAEWAEDEDVWLPQSLIVSCVGTSKNCRIDLEQFNPEKNYESTFFGGLDLAQTRDYCVFSVVESLNDKLYLRFLKIFHQPITYAHVLGFIKQIQDRFGSFDKIRVDYTREGPSIITNIEKSGIFRSRKLQRAPAKRNGKPAKTANVKMQVFLSTNKLGTPLPRRHMHRTKR